jgi:hypothetical protein
MNEEKINKYRKLGWKLNIQDFESEYKATFWRVLPGDKVQNAVGYAPTLNEAIEKAAKQISVENLYADMVQRGIFKETKQ